MHKHFAYKKTLRTALCLLLPLLLGGCAAKAPAPAPAAQAAPATANELPASEPAPAGSPVAEAAPAVSAAPAGSFKETPNKDNYENAPISYLSERIPVSFTTTSLDGRLVKSDELFGAAKVTMLTIWSTTCGVCISEMPHWAEYAKAYEGTGFQVVGLCSDAVEDLSETLETPKELVKETGADYLQLTANQDVYNALLSNVMYVPTTVFVDANGQMICSALIGAQSPQGWINTIETLMHEEA